ncbi:MAG: hypothetical protein QNK65_04020 [Flavobacteriales bacterium]
MTKYLFTLFVFFKTALIAQIAPNLIVTDLEGNTQNLYNYLDEGKTVILDFFIVNCTSCSEGAPYLDDFWQANGPNGSDDIQVISIEVSETSDQLVQEIAESWNINNPIVNLAEPPVLFEPFIVGFPTYIVVCPDKSINSIVDFNFPETILSWEQQINSCDFGHNFTDANLYLDDVMFMACNETTQANIIVGNTGTTMINEFTIDVFVDATYHSTINWDYPLFPNENTNNTPYPIHFHSEHISGENIEFRVNAVGDMNSTNNIQSHPIHTGISSPHTELTLKIKMDYWASDNNWNIKNDAGEIIVQDYGHHYEPNEEIITVIALEPNNCFTFTINDDYGDGLCCTYGEGYFQLYSNEDTLIHNTIFEYTFQEHFHIGDLINTAELGLFDTNKINQIVKTRLYFNTIGQRITYPMENGVFIEKIIYENGNVKMNKLLIKN